MSRLAGRITSLVLWIAALGGCYASHAQPDGGPVGDAAIDPGGPSRCESGRIVIASHAGRHTDWSVVSMTTSGDRIAIGAVELLPSEPSDTQWLYVIDRDGTLRSPPSRTEVQSHVFALGDGFAVTAQAVGLPDRAYTLQRYDREGVAIGAPVPIGPVDSARPYHEPDGSTLLLLGDRFAATDRFVARLRVGASGGVEVERTGLVIADRRFSDQALLAVGPDRVAGHRGADSWEARTAADGSTSERALTVQAVHRFTAWNARWSPATGGWVVGGAVLGVEVPSVRPGVALADGSRTRTIDTSRPEDDFEWGSGPVEVAVHGDRAVVLSKDGTGEISWARIGGDVVESVRRLDRATQLGSIGLEALDDGRAVAVYGSGRDLVLRCDLPFAP